MGFEPTYDGFANRCLTTWLPRRKARRLPHPASVRKRFRAHDPQVHPPGRHDGEDDGQFELGSNGIGVACGATDGIILGSPFGFTRVVP
jgi:hypothetical protein